MRQTIGVALMLAVVTVGFSVMFSNPDMTRTRLTIEFWWAWLLLLSVALVAMWLMNGKARR